MPMHKKVSLRKLFCLFLVCSIMVLSLPTISLAATNHEVILEDFASVSEWSTYPASEWFVVENGQGKLYPISYIGNDTVISNTFKSADICEINQSTKLRINVTAAYGENTQWQLCIRDQASGYIRVLQDYCASTGLKEYSLYSSPFTGAKAFDIMLNVKSSTYYWNDKHYVKFSSIKVYDPGYQLVDTGFEIDRWTVSSNLTKATIVAGNDAQTQFYKPNGSSDQYAQIPVYCPYGYNASFKFTVNVASLSPNTQWALVGYTSGGEQLQLINYNSSTGVISTGWWYYGFDDIYYPVTSVKILLHSTTSNGGLIQISYIDMNNSLLP